MNKEETRARLWDQFEALYPLIRLMNADGLEKSTYQAIQWQIDEIETEIKSICLKSFGIEDEE